MSTKYEGRAVLDEVNLHESDDLVRSLVVAVRKMVIQKCRQKRRLTANETAVHKALKELDNG